MPESTVPNDHATKSPTTESGSLRADEDDRDAGPTLEERVMELEEDVTACEERIDEVLQSVAETAALARRILSKLEADAEVVMARKVIAEEVQVGHWLHVGRRPSPRIHIASEVSEDYAGITGYAKGDDVGFTLDAAKPESGSLAERAYGMLAIFDGLDNARARVVVADDIRVRDGLVIAANLDDDDEGKE